mgnify:CR=1 FL=1
MEVFILQPLTGKELEYIADSMSNEDLLIKQCLAAAAQSPNIAVQQICKQLLTQHQQHYQGLFTLLQQHSPIAPKTVQEATQMEQMQQAQTTTLQNQQMFNQQHNPGFQ